MLGHDTKVPEQQTPAYVNATVLPNGPEQALSELQHIVPEVYACGFVDGQY